MFFQPGDDAGMHLTHAGFGQAERVADFFHRQFFVVIQNNDESFVTIQALGDDLHDTHQGVALCVRQARGASVSSMRSMMDVWRQQKGPGIMVIVGGDASKQSVVLGVKEYAKSATDLLNTIFAPFQGRGGGKSDLAQGGCEGNPSSGALMTSLKNAVANNA